MSKHLLRWGRAALASTALASAALIAAPFASAPAFAGVPSPLSSRTHFFVPKAPDGSKQQIAKLLKSGQKKDAALIAAEVTTPQAVWFTDGTPKQVRQQVRQVAHKAAAKRAVPTLVVYNVPGRDCSQYSSGGAGSDAAYRAWIDGFAGGLVKGQKVIVVVEPDGLTNLPADCPSAYPGQDVGTFPNPAPGTLTAGRIADIAYAGKAITKANRNALVYLDAGHSGWKGVGELTDRLLAAKVQQVQGFSLNVSNYQWTSNLSEYGTWVSSCLALHPDGKNTADCPNQYWNGGPGGPAAPVALDNAKQWSPTATDPAANTAGIDARFATALAAAKVQPTARFVLDTSRNGQGPWTPAAGTSYPDPQTWCNPPGRGLGARPKAVPSKAYPQLDAYLWIKTPGQSDGQCNRGVAGSTTDPEWGGITDPAAGAWFPQQALQLAKLASPKLSIRH